jgi:hypothetical protein
LKDGGEGVTEERARKPEQLYRGFALMIVDQEPVNFLETRSNPDPR